MAQTIEGFVGTSLDSAKISPLLVQRLLKTREVLTQKSIDRGFLKTTEDESLLALPGELEKRSAEMAATAERRKQGSGGIMAGDATPDVLAAVQEIAHLLGGNLEDQTLARTKLQALIDSLQGRPATK